jgi:hypothetical protein
VTDVCRLDAKSAFYRPKQHQAGAPPRVRPVSLILTPGGNGRRLDASAFRLAPVQDVDGIPLRDIARIRLAPWLGPDGIFLVDGTTRLPREHLVPAVEPADIDGNEILPPVERRSGFPWFGLSAALSVPMGGAGDAVGSAAAPCR